MTKKKLSQLYYLKKEIKEQQKKIKELETAATSFSSKMDGLPKGDGTSDKIGNYVAQIADLKSLLDLNLKKYFYELKQVNRYIQSIEDNQMRKILTLRYIKCLTWQNIAYEIGKRDEQYPRRKHNAFLRNSEKINS